MLVASQDFVWHDAGEGAIYVFGEDGYLRMDGSRGRVVCSRRLREAITGPEDALEVRLRVVLGKSYSILLLGAPVQPAIECRLDADGLVRFACGAQVVSSGKSLTFQRGQPYADPSSRKWYVVESDEHRLRFERFDFAARTFAFALDDDEPVLLHGSIATDALSLTAVALLTHDVEVGSMIRLRELSQLRGPALVDRETFPIHWAPVPPPADGMPDDNVCETLMRPVDYRWLETRTEYGYVKARIPPLPAGTIEFEMKTADAANESCLVLEEYEGIIKSGNIQVGLLGGRMIFFGGGEVLAFDQPIEARNERVYRVRVCWDTEARECRMWLDDEPLSCGGSYALPLVRPPKRGIDTITLHPGDAGARLTSLQKRQGQTPRQVAPLISCWGRLRVYDSPV
jgi:hypothetical protein